MKKIMLLAVVATMFAACTQDEGTSVVRENGNQMNVTIETPSRVQLAEGKTVWTAGDRLSVFNKTTANECWQFDGATGDVVGTISKVSGTSGSAIPAIYAIYPYNSAAAISPSGISTTLPEVQSYLADSYGVGANLMGAIATDMNLAFKNLVGYLRLSFSGYKAVKSIALSGNNGEKLAGSVTIAEDLTLSLTEATATTVTLDCGEGVQLSSTPKVFYIALAPQTFTAGVKVVVTFTDNSVVEKSTANSITITRNHIQPLAAAEIGEESGEELPETIKILAIGNSFSADAVEQELYGLFEAIGQKVIIGNMYIGGCPLVTHAANATSDAAAYSYRMIVEGTLTKTANVKLSTALADEDWTFVSVQEGAGFHGFYNTTYNGTTHSMEPDLTTLVTYIQERCPKARLVYHAPWAAQVGYTGTKFSYYGFDQQKMYEMICTATQEVLAAHPEFNLVMNSMDAIQNARSSYLGDNLNRDGWHLNYTTGRYTAGCLWFERIMGQSVVGNTYRPSTITESQALVCQTAAHEAVLHPYTVTDLSYIEKPADEQGDEASMKTIAKWYFSRERTVNDGLCYTWTGQNTLGVYRYSNDAGERGYMLANEDGAGRLSYVQIDKHAWDSKGNTAGLSTLDVSNGGQPVMSAPMAGDYWQFETTGGNEFAEGSQLHIVYTYNPGSYGAQYWILEYKDGDEFRPVPAFEMKNTTISASKETIDYNIEFTTEQRIVEFTVTLENPTTEFVVRQRCCSSYQVNNKWFNYPNVKCVSRIAGDPANPAKPLPEMMLVL